MKPRIVILIHEHGALDDALYTMGELAAHWQSHGCEVTVAKGPNAVPEHADVGILHVDTTKVDASYVEALKRCKIVLNGSTDDISKRAISKNLVRRGDGYAGPVIVKTDANHAGIKEVDLAVAQGGLLGVWLRARNKLPWYCRTRLKLKEYRIFDAVNQVPWPVWFNRDLVVEKLMTERRDGVYLMGCWIFLGDRGFAYEYECDDAIVTARNVKSITFGKPVPDELRSLRKELKFDFGKFDFVRVGGKAVLFDANRTPTDRALRCYPDYAARVKDLSQGLFSFIQPTTSAPHAPLIASITTA